MTAGAEILFTVESAASSTALRALATAIGIREQTTLAAGLDWHSGERRMARGRPDASQRVLKPKDPMGVWLATCAFVESEVADPDPPTLEATMPEDASRPAQAAIRTDLGAIFVSMELSRRVWLITSLSPGAGEKMSKLSVPASGVFGLLRRFAELWRKAVARTGRDFPIIVIQETGIDGFWIQCRWPRHFG
jgi:hypothetical protein